MTLTVTELYNYSSTWYAQDIDGNIALMALQASYMPEYIIENEQLYYELDEHMTDLWNKYSLCFTKQYFKKCKKDKIDYLLWLESNYKGVYCYRGNCEYWQIKHKDCKFKKYIKYDCMPTYNKIQPKCDDVQKITIKDLPEKFNDIIPKYKINFKNADVIEDVSKFVLPDHHAKKKYPWLKN